MALSIAQSALSSSTQPWSASTSAVLTFGSALTVGSTVVIGFGMDASTRTISSVQDNGDTGGNSYAQATTAEWTSNFEGWLYYARVTKANTTAVTVTISSILVATGVLFGWEVAGAHLTTPLGNVATPNVITVSTTSHPVPAAGNLSLTDATAMLLGFSYGSTGTWTLDAGYTLVTGWTRNIGTAGYRIVSAEDNMVNTTSGNEQSLNFLIEIRPAVSGDARKLVRTFLE